MTIHGGVRVEKQKNNSRCPPRRAGFRGAEQGKAFGGGERGLFLYAVREFFDDGVGQDFAGDALDLSADGVRLQPIGEGKREILALAHRGYIGETDLSQGILDGLALGVQDRCLQRDIDMRLHYP